MKSIIKNEVNNRGRIAWLSRFEKVTIYTVCGLLGSISRKAPIPSRRLHANIPESKHLNVLGINLRTMALIHCYEWVDKSSSLHLFQAFPPKCNTQLVYGKGRRDVDLFFAHINQKTIYPMKKAKATLVLEDGSAYEGYSFGYQGSSAGELVFNTAMTGYPESLTDPSYKGQVLVATYPLIGNYGVPDNTSDDAIFRFWESEAIQVSALVVSEYSEQFSHWNASQSLSAWLQEHKIPAISGIDTRALAKKLRERGSTLAKIVTTTDVAWRNPNAEDLVGQVSTKEKQVYGNGKYRIALVDCGVKNNIIRCLLARDTTVVRLPYDYDFNQEAWDGLFLSNGPGDPKMNTKTIAHLKKAMEGNKPIMGICLGTQLMALATGANTYKLPYGHRSHNQPVILSGTDRCFITSQNHGFAIDTTTLSTDWAVLFENANDGTCEGIDRKSTRLNSSH